MKFTRKRRTPFGLNTTSTADISFVLLIFFLVTTSMDTDKGLSRQLPPMEQQQPQQPETEVDRRNILTFTLTASDQLLADGQQIAPAEVEDRVLKFVTARGKAHLVMLNISDAATYDAYFNLQNAIVAGYRHWRNDIARQRYHNDYQRCTEEQRAALREACPQRIMEDSGDAEGRNRP